MNVFEAIHTRRSVRRFTEEPVTDEHIETLLRAAMAAPTAGNSQCWRFVVITDKKLLQCLPTIQPHARAAEKSALTVVVCADLGVKMRPDRWVQDLSAAMQNVLLAARGLGLGACWCTVHPEPEWERGVAELCGLPVHIRPLALCAVGHPDAPQEVVDRFDPDKIHYNTW